VHKKFTHNPGREDGDLRMWMWFKNQGREISAAIMSMAELASNLLASW
jgi:hypothetical protein